MSSTPTPYALALAVMAERQAVQPNWGLLMALGFNVVAWWGIAQLLGLA